MANSPQPEAKRRSSGLPGPLEITLRIILIVALVETVVMFALGFGTGGGVGLTHALADTLFLVLAVTPILWWWVIRPYVQARDDALAAANMRALKDPLTGLANRRLLQLHLAQCLARLERSDIHAALVFLDLDGFKEVNDTLGHAAGDTLLKAVSERVSGSCRGGDVLARIGGDEFVLLLDDLAPDLITARRQAARVARKVRGLVRVPVQYDGQVAQVGCSVGIRMMTPGPGQDAARALRDADHAMYTAKTRGKGGIIFADQAAGLSYSLLATGVEQLDADHEAIDEVLRSLLLGGVAPETGLNRVLTLMRAHFAREAGLARSMDLAFSESHEQAHVALLGVFGRLAAAADAQTLPTVVEQMSALLHSHVVEWDLELLADR
jgi:two-component system, cell cycle response regulator